jgi:hypothetical protein
MPQIVVYNLAEFGMLHGCSGAPHGLHQYHAGIQKAFAKDALTDHTGGAK